MNKVNNPCFLYIVDSFPPLDTQIGIRSLEISKRLIKKKIFPIILTKKINFKKKITHNKNYAIPTSLKIYKTNFFEFKNRFLLALADRFFRIDYYLGWIPSAYFTAKRLLKNNKNIKFIYASGPSFNTHIISFLIKKKFNLPLVIEYRDPWSFNPYEGKNFLWLNRKINLKLERKINKLADIIISVSPELNSFLKKRFLNLKDKQMHSIANGLNVRKTSAFYKKDENKIVFTFTGALYRKRTIIPLLKLVSILKKENFFSEINILIKIFGIYDKKLLQDVVRKLQIEDIAFLGKFIERTKALEEIYNSDLAIHIGENLNYPTIAFKVWDYLSCRKKILYLGLEDSYTAKFLAKNDLGITIPLNNLIRGKEILKNLIIKLKDKEFKSTVDEIKIKEYSWDNRSENFIKNVIEKIN